MKVFDSTFSALNKAMDLRFKRHAVLASNVANSETPNFKGRELDFAGELSRALTYKSASKETEGLVKTNSSHMDIGGSDGAHVILDRTSQVGADGNNVDLDISMGKISENSRSYNGAATYMALKLQLLKTAVRGGGA